MKEGGGGEDKSPEFVKWFSKINKDMNSIVGEKGANLGELYSNKFPVSNGFIITGEAYSNFLVASKLDEKIINLFEGIDIEDHEIFSNAIKKIKEIFSNSELPEEMKEEIIDSYQILGTNKLEIEKGSALDILNNATEPIFVSVRSSLCFKSERKGLTREQDTYLNIKGNDDLLLHVKNAFLSLFNPDTIKRTIKKGKKISDLKIAVIVQKMINSEKSGFVHSKNSSGNILIESIWGVGEGINIKEITPDKYILSKELQILDKKIGEKNFMVARASSGSLKTIKSSEERKKSQVLNNYEIQRLGDLAEKIESHFGSPQKIEFAIDESGIYILQTEKISQIEKPEEGLKGPDSETAKKEEQKKEKKSLRIGKVEKVTRTKLKLVVDSPYMTQEGSETGLKKVGILKIEKIIENGKKHPFYFLESHYINQYENLIYEGIKSVFDNFEEVWVRTGDFLSNEALNLEGGANFREENPLLGLHGIRFSLKYPDVFTAELRAIKRAAKRDCGVLLPNVTSVGEIKKAREIIKNMEMDVNLGVVIDTPAGIQLIKEFCEENVDLILINADRLIGYLLALDLSNENVKPLFDELHPSFLYQLEYLIRVSKRNKIETNLFGESLKNPELLKYLVKRGIDFVSVEPEDAREFSQKIFDFEKDFVKGTDSEPREYEMKKSKEDYLKEKPPEKVKKKEESGDILGIF